MQAFKKGEYSKYLNGHALSYFMEQFRSLLVWEDGNTLWLAKATPRHWLEQGKKISVKNAPTYFGTVSYEIVSDVDNGKITATVEMPSRNPPKSVLLRFRHPTALPIKSVLLNGRPWSDFDPAKETIRLHGVSGELKVEAHCQEYRDDRNKEDRHALQGPTGLAASRRSTNDVAAFLFRRFGSRHCA